MLTSAQIFSRNRRGLIYLFFDALAGVFLPALFIFEQPWVVYPVLQSTRASYCTHAYFFFIELFFDTVHNVFPLFAWLSLELLQ